MRSAVALAPIVQLAATASRSLPTVAWHAIGYAEPRPGGHSHGPWHPRGERSRLASAGRICAGHGKTRDGQGACCGLSNADTESMKRVGQVVAMAAAVLTAGCTAGAPSAGPSRRHPEARPPAHRAVPASCPVTRPIPHTAPPAQLHAIDNFTYYLHGWYGNTALWVGVPIQGVLPAGHPYGTPQAANRWGTKFPWWPVLPGRLTIIAHRLDGPSAGFRSQVTGLSSIGKAHFIPSSLLWPAPGCWQVTGTVSGHSLTFVAWVRTVPS